MSYYAVYEIGYAIYGIGETPDEARADAAHWLGLDTKAAAAILMHRRGQCTVGNLVVIPCTEALAKQASRHGRRPGFFAVDGMLCTIEESGAL